MFEKDQYSLLDVGEGRRLERFGALVLDRFCPAVENIRKNAPKIWEHADALFVVDSTTTYGRKTAISQNQAVIGERGHWIVRTKVGAEIFSQIANKNSQSWQIRHDTVTFELRGTPFGHVGIFPEQAENWTIIKRQCNEFVASKFSDDVGNPLKPCVLNLFAYTGGSTLAAAAGGAEVTHIDAAKNVVTWAKKNAEISHFSHLPIKWIAEDAKKFVRRELKRGNSYHGIILDPPSYGHGTHGEEWRLSKQLPSLLFDCFSLLDPRYPCFLLLTCHTPGFSSNQLAKLMHEIAAKTVLQHWKSVKNSYKNRKFDSMVPKINQKTMMLHAESGINLPSGESLLFLL